MAYVTREAKVQLGPIVHYDKVTITEPALSLLAWLSEVVGCHNMGCYPS